MGVVDDDFVNTTAEQDRVDIVDLIAQDIPRAAVRMDELFGAAVADWSSTAVWAAWTDPGYPRLIPHESDRLVYEAQADTVWILALVHSARLWPPARQ